MRSHVLHMILFSGIVSAFFALLTRDGRRARFRLALILLVAMVGLSLALAWAMYPFPSK